MKLLVSAYSCEPNRGSEPGVGWNAAKTLARHHEVWVITVQHENYPVIKAELEQNPIPNLHFAFYDIFSWLGRRKAKTISGLLHYYLWQIGVFFHARKLHREVGFDVVHHITYVRYWTTSFLALLPIPFVWGPVGGGESAPKNFVADLGLRGRLLERLRNVAKRIGECDPFLRICTKRSAIAIATTSETEQRMRKLGAREVTTVSQCALNATDIDFLGRLPANADGKIRFISIGRLEHWKGFHLGLEAFTKSRLDAAEFWIVGDGPERRSLERLAAELEIGDRVRFWGHCNRDETLQKLAHCDVLVHPSLHDSGGFVCMEAMAARRPVICLELGGPAHIVNAECGIKVPARSPSHAVADLARAMRTLAENEGLRDRMGESGRNRVKDVFEWDKKISNFNALYNKILVTPAVQTADSMVEQAL